MEVIRYVASKKLLTFILATLTLQLFVVLSGLYLKWKVPKLEIGLSNRLTHESINNDYLIEEQVSQEANKEIGIETVSYTVQAGDSFTKIWVKYTGSSAGAIKAFDALKANKINSNFLKAGSVVELNIVQQDITSLRADLVDGQVLTLVGDSIDGYTAEVIKPEIIEQEKTISGIIDSSFSRTAYENKIPYQIVDQVVDLFGARMEFRKDVQPGDTFSIIYTEKRLADGRIVEPGAIKGASFSNNGRWFAAVSHIDDSGKRIFFDDQGNALGNFFLRYPLQFSRISSAFTHARFHPILKKNRPHNGVDFAAPVGTPVRSVADGIVVDAGYRGGAGKMVKIDHGDKYATAYLHLSAIASNVKRGQKISRGEVIGKVGSTGYSTGPHLHYSFYINGKYVDPLKVELPQMPSGKTKIPREQLDQIILALKTSEQNMLVALNHKRSGDA